MTRALYRVLRLAGVAIAIVCGHGGTASAQADLELLGEAGLQLRYFPQEPLDDRQEEGLDPSMSGKGRLLWNSRDRSVDVAIEGFVRVDAEDPERTHADVREALLTYNHRHFAFSAGIGQVFWGVAESRHLIDIVNQIDRLERPDTDAKLGQPLVRMAFFIPDGGVLELLTLVGFRDREYPGRQGRLRFPLLVDDDPSIESPLGRASIERIVRWSGSFGPWDLGVYYFYGTSREPELLFSPPPTMEEEPRLTARYSLIHQGAAQAQLTLDAWLFKAETMMRTGQGPIFAAAVGGLEYTLYSVGEILDVGLLAEYNYDGRDNETFTPFQNDGFVGLRLAGLGTSGSELLAGAYGDVEHGTVIARVEASRRLTETWTVELRGFLVANAPTNDLVSAFRDDDYVELTLKGYF